QRPGEYTVVYHSFVTAPHIIDKHVDAAVVGHNAIEHRFDLPVVRVVAHEWDAPVIEILMRNRSTGDVDGGALQAKFLRDAFAHATTAASDQCNLSFQHDFPSRVQS